MNQSWNKNYSTSPGFVYFNTDSQKPPADTQDFLSFQESPPSSNYSSNYNRNSPSTYGTPKFHSSPRKFNNRNSYRLSGGNNGRNRSFYSPNNSFNNSWSSQRSPKFYNQRQNSNHTPMMSKDGTRDMSMFYDPTSTQNPWEHLEKQLEMEKATELVETEKKSVNTSEIIKNVEKDDDDGQSSSSSSEGGESDSSSSSEEEEKVEETP